MSLSRVSYLLCMNFALCCSTFPLFATESFEIEREGKAKLVFYLDKPETTPFSMVLIIPGSQKETTLRTHDAIKSDLNEIGKCVFSLEKQGIQGEEVDELEFNQHLTLDERIEDHLEVIEAVKEGFIKGWNGKISIIGQGDGGRIGAKLAAKLKNVEALILIASGGGWPPLEETLFSFRSEMADGGYSPQYIHGFLVQAKQEFAQALKAPKPDYKAFGYTYKYWESLLKTNLLNDLSVLNCPIYSVNGENDDRVPIQSVNAMAAHLKERLTLRRKEKAGRELIKDQEIYKEAISWLFNELKK